MRRSVIERAGLWSAIDIGARQGTQFVVTMILARVLSPAQFGVVAITMFFSSLATFGIQNVIATTLLRSPMSTLEEESSLYWLNIAASLACAALAFLSGPAIARTFGSPILAQLMIPVAFQIAIGALGTVPGAIMIRTMRFRELAVIGLVANLAGGIVGVILALEGFGAWALALQAMIGIGLNALGCVARSGWRPKAYVGFGRIVDHLRFSAWLAVSSLLEVFYLQVSTLLIGKVYGPGPLGIYTRASSIQLLTASLVQAVIGRVSLPVFASRNDNPQNLRAALLGSIHLVMFCFVPLLVGVGCCAREVLLVLFGPQWLAAAPLLTVLAFGGTLYPIQLLNEQLLLAQGRSDTVFKLSVLRKSLGILCVVAGSMAGLLGLAWGQFAGMLLGAILAMTATGRLFDYGFAAQAREIWKPFAAAGAMSVFLLIAKRSIDLPPLAELLILILLGVITYLAASAVLQIRALSELLRSVRTWRHV